MIDWFEDLLRNVQWQICHVCSGGWDIERNIRSKSYILMWSCKFSLFLKSYFVVSGLEVQILFCLIWPESTKCSYQLVSFDLYFKCISYVHDNIQYIMLLKRHTKKLRQKRVSIIVKCFIECHLLSKLKKINFMNFLE